MIAAEVAAPSEKKAARPAADLLFLFLVKKAELSLMILSASSARLVFFCSPPQSFFRTKYASSNKALLVLFI